MGRIFELQIKLKTIFRFLWALWLHFNYHGKNGRYLQLWGIGRLTFVVQLSFTFSGSTLRPEVQLMTLGKDARSFSQKIKEYNIQDSLRPVGTLKGNNEILIQHSNYPFSLVRFRASVAPEDIRYI